MSEQQYKVAKEAVWKFISAFIRGRGDITSNYLTVLGIMGTILYLMKKGYVKRVNNYSEGDGIVISQIDLSYMKITNSRIYDDWKERGIFNESLIAIIPDDDPMNETAITDIEFAQKAITQRTLFFDFFSTISKYTDYPLFHYDVLALALSLHVTDPSFFWGHYIQPKEFAQLASQLLDVTGKSIINPFAGLMMYYMNLDGYDSYTCMENDSVIYKINKYLISLAQKGDMVRCLFGDIDWPEGKKDIIVTTPPLGKSVPLTEPQWLSFEKFEEATTDQGVLFTIVSPSLLYDSTNYAKNIRREITDKNYLDTIILLPAKLMHPYTSVHFVTVMLKKGRNAGEPVKMIDASSFVLKDDTKSKLDIQSVMACVEKMDSDNCIFVSIDEIRNNGYNWDAHRYLKQRSEIFPKGYTVIELGDIVEIVRGAKDFDNKKGHLAAIPLLSHQGADCVKELDWFNESDDLSGTIKITETVILLSRVGDLRPTYCKASKDHPLFIRPQILAFRLKKDWISPTYLCLELSRRGTHLAGAYTHRTTLSDLMRLKIAFPSIGRQQSLDEQNNLYMEAAYSLKLAKVKEMGLQDVIEKMKTDYMLEVRNRKHDMKTPMVQLRSTLKLLSLFSKELPSNKADKMNDYIQRQKTALDTLSEIVKHLADEEKFAEPEILNVDEILSSFVTNESYYSIKYWKDDISFEEAGIDLPLIKMGRSDFLRLVNNIIGNAIMHGFIDKNGAYSINIYTYAEHDMLRISFQNDGNPLPKEIDKARYGMRMVKGKDSKGQGTGGYVVKSIVEHYEGDYDVYVEKLDDGAELTFVDVKLPIYRNDE